MKRAFILTLLALLGSPAVMAEAWLEAGSERQHFDNGNDDATIQSLVASYKVRDRVVYGELTHQDRFGRQDTSALLGAYVPLTRRGQLHVEASVTPDPELKPRHTAYAGWYQSLPGGWALEPGVQSTQYRDLRVARYSLNVERYLSNWRLLYGIADVHLEGSSSLNHRVQADYYYGERNHIGVGHAWGDDQESLPGGVITTPVRSHYLSGQHQIAPRLSILYLIQDTEQGSLYRQTGGRFGLRYHF